ncbi:SDR family NAD(P)-dependent oxidoreductase [Cohnella mopanensis]|uniref:SDR family NAD(P)-dependent oxidoreductase n=1 Tax=Cohnella mopanensis TaxID=2911966 RepID=UPI001EF78D75|nr:SDR family oxidoreductase [Cohnella mopanensis]
MRKLLDKELVVVTGAANGIGRAIAERFISEGADLIVADHNIENAKKVYEGNSQVVDILKVDATNVNDLEKIAESVKKTGRKLKAVLPIVGNGPQSPISEVTPEQFHLTMNLNVFSAFFTVQKLLPYMSDKSSIVLISSIAGFQGGKNAIIYNAAKAAVRSMARSFTGELAEKGIRANAISPGPTETKAFTNFIHGDEELRSHIVSQLPIGHIGKPSEIAAVALFLASDESSYVTGAEIIADGGFTNR